MTGASDADRPVTEAHFAYAIHHAFRTLNRPALKPYRYSRKVVSTLQKVGTGEIRRLMIVTPPRAGKSTIAGQLFPAWWLLRNPRDPVLIASYGQRLTDKLSRGAREFYPAMGGRMGRVDKVAEWTTADGGGVFATSMGGALAGHGAALIVLDDPLRGREAADSPSQLEKLHDWLSEELMTRFDNPASSAFVLIGTRWAEADAHGFLLDLDKTADAKQGWQVLHLPMEAEDSSDLYPDLIGYDHGPSGLLCPERWDAETVAAMREVVRARGWASLFQGRPGPREGAMFQKQWLRFVDSAPDEGDRVRFWDLASTEGAGNYTAGCLMSRHGDPPVWTIEDVRRGQWGPARRDREILQVAEMDGDDVVIWLEGTAAVTYAIASQLAGFVVHSEQPTKGKEERADPLSSQVEAGRVEIVRGPWRHEFVAELLGFPSAKYDDQVDSASGAFGKLVTDTGPSVTFEDLAGALLEELGDG